MIALRTPRLLLRNWEERDRALFFRINSDETVMRYFPFRRSRAESDALMDRLRTGIAETGYGFCAAELLATGECIGFIGLNRVNAIPGLEPGTVEIELWEGARQVARFRCDGGDRRHGPQA